MTVFVERGDTARRLVAVTRNESGFLGGLTLVASVFDGAAPTNKWLNLATGQWQATKQSEPMTQESVGIHAVAPSFANTLPTSKELLAFYEVTGGDPDAVGLIVWERLVMVDSIHPKRYATADSERRSALPRRERRRSGLKSSRARR